MPHTESEAKCNRFSEFYTTSGFPSLPPSPSGTRRLVLSAGPDVQEDLFRQLCITCVSERIALSTQCTSQSLGRFGPMPGSRRPLTLSHAVHKRISLSSLALTSVLGRPCVPLLQEWGFLRAPALSQWQITSVSSFKSQEHLEVFYWLSHFNYRLRQVLPTGTTAFSSLLSFPQSFLGDLGGGLWTKESKHTPLVSGASKNSKL